MANIYGSTLTTGGTVQDVEQWPDSIRKVTADEIRAVAARYLRLDHSVTGYLLPQTKRRTKGSMNRMNKIAANDCADSAFRHRRCSLRWPCPTSSLPGRSAQRGRRDPGGEVATKGITAWLVEDYSVPIIAIRFVFDGGSTQDPPARRGWPI